MSLAIKLPLAPASRSALERPRCPAAASIGAEKDRLRKATKEFESFFVYQMLKTMRQTIPENPLTKDTPMTGGLGKDTFTELFDMEVARKINMGGHSSIAELLYKSMEKLVDAQFHEQASDPTMGPLRPPDRIPVELKTATSLPLPGEESGPVPVQKHGGVWPIPISHRRVRGDELLLKYGKYIHEAARETRLDSAIITSVIRAESGGNPRAVSKAGAKGLMQLTDSTARELSVNDAFDPRENIRAGSRYLRRMLDRFGDLRLALAAYNAGPANVEKYGGVPPFAETRRYLERVIGFVKEATRK